MKHLIAALLASLVAPPLLFALGARETAALFLALTVILWKTFGLDHTLTERVSGYLIALILVVAVSLMAPSPPPPEARVFQVSREGAPL